MVSDSQRLKPLLSLNCLDSSVNSRKRHRLSSSTILTVATGELSLANSCSVTTSINSVLQTVSRRPKLPQSDGNACLSS